MSVECVSICKYPKGDGSGRYDCSPIPCAWKAPRALTGLLASTANSSALHVQSGRKIRRGHVILTCPILRIILSPFLLNVVWYKLMLVLTLPLLILPYFCSFCRFSVLDSYNSELLLNTSPRILEIHRIELRKLYPEHNLRLMLSACINNIAISIWM